MELKTFFAQDLQGNVIPNPTVTLYLPGTTTLAAGLENSAGAELSNPFTGGSTGQIVLAAPDGDYDMKIAGGGRELVMRVRFNSASDTALDAAAAASASAGAALASAGEAEAARVAAVAAHLATVGYAEAAAQSAEEAALSAQQAGQFNPDDFVPRAGGVTMTGPLEVPAGASGAQVPQAQEVLLRFGASAPLPTADIGPIWHDGYASIMTWQEIGSYEGYASARLAEVTFRAVDDPLPGTLVADGATVSRTTYAALFAAIGTTFGVGDGSTTFNLPDLRGEFIRGWDAGRGVDSGRAFGSQQATATQEHVHPQSSRFTASYSNGDGFAYTNGGSTIVNGTVSTQGMTSATGESRPRNIALLPMIYY